MQQFRVKVGEHQLQINLVGSELHMLKENFQFVPLVEYRDPDLFIHIEMDYGIPFVNYDVKITRHQGSIQFSRADYVINVDVNFKEARLFAHNELALKHALMNLYSSFIVHNNWGLLLHSSCVLEEGKAHIFSGHSGAGKSTAAKFSAPRELLSDEATLLKITPGSITVFTSPFRSELETSKLIEKSTLGSIQLLQQSLTNSRKRLKQSDALLELVDKVFFWSHDKEGTKQIFSLLNQLVKTVPVYNLHFQKNNTFWELIS